MSYEIITKQHKSKIYRTTYIIFKIIQHSTVLIELNTKAPIPAPNITHQGLFFSKSFKSSFKFGLRVPYLMTTICFQP
ncbi:MAG: hypothetical protein RLZZ540_499 [Bacteroidota bacterium]|jgi:hypothetical protein